MEDILIPKNLEGKRIFYSGIENLAIVEEDLYAFLNSISLGNVLNIEGEVDFEPVRPDDAIARALPGALNPPAPDDKKDIAEFNKLQKLWLKDCAKVYAMVKNIYSPAILTTMKTLITSHQYTYGNRENILLFMTTVRRRWGAWSQEKSDLCEKTFRELPKLTSCDLVISVLNTMRYEIRQQEAWSDIPNNVDHRFSETTKKSRLVSIMDSWDELKILHNRVRLEINTLTYDEIVQLLLDAIKPLQEAELILRQTSAHIDRNHSSMSSSMGAFNNNSNWRDSSNKTSFSQVGITCHNCNESGHKSYQCDAPICNKCQTNWASTRAPGYHHNTKCPNGKSYTQSMERCTNCQTSGHVRKDCLRPICSTCGTTWISRQHPNYHHFDKCPAPFASSSSSLGKRSNPYATARGRAHMTSLREHMYSEESEEKDDTTGWSDDETPTNPWKQHRNV
jgi:hypothetical protein